MSYLTVNHGLVVDSINVNGFRCGSSEGGTRTTIELEADENIVYVGAKQVRNSLFRIDFDIIIFFIELHSL